MTKGRQGPTVERVELAARVKALREDPNSRDDRDRPRGWRSIAAELGISRSYASELYIDPLGDKSRQRKDGYARPCANFEACGNYVSGSDGPNNLPTHCQACAPIFTPTREWTRETVIAAFQAYHRQWGRAPSANHRTILAPSQHTDKHFSDERMAEAATNTIRLPHPQLVKNLFGSWPAAIEAAGLPVNPRGSRAARTPRRRLNPDRSNDPLVLNAIRQGHESAYAIRDATGIYESSVYLALRRLVHSGQVERTGKGHATDPYRFHLPKEPPMPVGKEYVVLYSDGEDTWREHHTQALTPDKAIERVANGSDDGDPGVGAGTYVCIPASLFVTQPVGEVTKLAVLVREE